MAREILISGLTSHGWQPLLCENFSSKYFEKNFGDDESFQAFLKTLEKDLENAFKTKNSFTLSLNEDRFVIISPQNLFAVKVTTKNYKDETTMNNFTPLY